MTSHYKTDQGKTAIFMPLTFEKRGGRKLLIAPSQGGAQDDNPKIDPTMVKALVRAHLWQSYLKQKKYATLRELCEALGITQKYAQMVMHLNFLSPFIKDAILQGTQPKGLKLSELMREMPLLWEAQEKLFGFKKPPADCSK